MKQKILEEQQQEPMEYDNEDNFLECIGPDQSMEEDEDLLDENEEEEDGGEEDDEEGEGGHGAVVGEGRGEAYAVLNDYRNEKMQGEERSGEVIPAAAEGPSETAEPAAIAADLPRAATAAGSGDTGIELPDVRGGEDGNGGNVEIQDYEEEEDDQVFEDDVEDELDSRLKPDHRFFAVRALVEGGKKARKLNRRMKATESKDNGFLLKGDERYFRNYNESSIERRVNVSVSFMYNGTCNTCLSGPHDAWQGREGQPVVIVAGDHHFPANIPAKGDGECIRILRVENGSLAEITGELIRLSPRGGAVPGTVVMLGSAVMLGVESVAYYGAEWKRCRNIIKQEMGEVIVIPLLHLSPVGIEDKTIFRSLLDMASWYDDMEEVELKLIRNTRMNFMEVNLARLERGPGWADTHINSRMPVSLSASSAGTTAYVTGDWGRRPERIAPLTEHGESKAVNREDKRSRR